MTTLNQLKKDLSAVRDDMQLMEQELRDMRKDLATVVKILEGNGSRLPVPDRLLIAEGEIKNLQKSYSRNSKILWRLIWGALSVFVIVIATLIGIIYKDLRDDAASPRAKAKASTTSQVQTSRSDL